MLQATVPNRPYGVLFDPACRTRDTDLANYAAILPLIKSEVRRGRFIATIVQTRNTRSWSATKRNYDYVPADDYLMAVYSVDPSACTPYVPGAVAAAWLGRTIAIEARQSVAADDKMVQLFQCSDQGCRLSTVGVMKLITFRMKTHNRADAVTWAKGEVGNAAKYGWRGGTLGAADALSEDSFPPETRARR
ncbi:hypothetical protein [Azospirillum doebereinerae]